MLTRPHRKRKTPDFLSSVHPNEERDLAKALYISLRPFPRGDVSEDDIQEEEVPEEDYDEVKEDFQDKIDERNREDPPGQMEEGRAICNTSSF